MTVSHTNLYAYAAYKSSWVAERSISQATLLSPCWFLHSSLTPQARRLPPNPLAHIIRAHTRWDEVT